MLWWRIFSIFGTILLCEFKVLLCSSLPFVGAAHIPYMLFNLAGEAWIHMVFGAVVEVALLGLIIRYAWKWPRIEP
jgi:hypothetical protein